MHSSFRFGLGFKDHQKSKIGTVFRNFHNPCFSRFHPVLLFAPISHFQVYTSPNVYFLCMICLPVLRLLFRLFVFVVTRDNIFSQLHIHRMKPGLSLYLCVLLCYDRCWTKNRPFYNNLTGTENDLIMCYQLLLILKWNNKFLSLTVCRFVWNPFDIHKIAQRNSSY